MSPPRVQQPALPEKGSRAWRRALAETNERAHYLLREAHKLLKRHGGKLDKAHLQVLIDTHDRLAGACEPKPKERDLAALLVAAQGLDEALEIHLGRHRKSALREYAEAITWAIALALLIRAFGFEAFKIPTGSMIPTLQVHDHLFVNKFVYGLKIPFTRIKLLQLNHPERGEIIVFEYPYTDDPDSVGKDLIKRVAATPGDRVQFKDNVLHINGAPIEREPYAELSDCGESAAKVALCSEAGADDIDGVGDWCVLAPEPGNLSDELHIVGRFDDETAANRHLQMLTGFGCQRARECNGDVRYVAQHRVPLDEGLERIWGMPLNDPNWPPRHFDPRRYGPEARRYTMPRNDAWPDFVVPEGHVLVMGDNRDNSKDGRFFGLVPFETIKGRASIIWYAFEREFYKPNWSRIGTVVHERVDGGCASPGGS